MAGRPGRTGVYTRHGVVARRAFMEIFKKNFAADKERLANELSAELRSVTETMMDDAAQGLEKALKVQVLEEGKTLNNMMWPVTSPVSVMAPMPVLADIAESPQGTSIVLKAINTKDMDEIDRQGSPTEVDVLIKSQRGQY
jgi:hypothetical protein